MYSLSVPLVRNFSFRLNTDADTFCAWLEDLSKSWRIGATGDNGGLVEIQGSERARLTSRTQYSFGAAIEVTARFTGGWIKDKKHVFPNGRKRGAIYRANVITIMVLPGTRAGKVDIRTLCNDKDAVDGFSQILTRIVKTYPEANDQLREQEEKQIL